MGTGFDTKLRICNFIRLLPRCNKGMKSDAEIEVEIEEDGKVEIEIKVPAKNVITDTFVNVTSLFFKGCSTESNAYHTTQNTVSINGKNDEEIELKIEEDGKLE